jgi:ATP-binding cassette subfamily F protein 3
VREFSGGEKARLTLALLVRQRPNLLLLDEPTNHLDIDMREALTEALQDYTGALIVVAHDRHLLRATADELWLVADGALAPFDGDLDDYRQWVLAGRGREAATVAGAAVLTPDRKTQKRVEAESRQRLSELRKPLQQKIERIERRIDLMSTEKRGLDEWLATSDAYIEENKERLIASLARRGDLAWELARDEAEWLELHEALERAAD